MSLNDQTPRMPLVKRTRDNAKQRAVLLAYHVLHVVDFAVFALTLSYLSSDFAATFIFSDLAEWGRP